MIDSFLQYLQYEKRFSEHTIEAYSLSLNQLTEFLEENFQISLIDVDYQQLRVWVVSQMEKGQNPLTINRRISAGKSFFKFLHYKGLIKSNPFARIQSLKKPKKLPAFIDQKQIKVLLERKSMSSDFAGFRDYIIIELFYATGMRLSELLSLKTSSVSGSAMEVKVLGKRNKERIIPFSRYMRTLLDRYMEMRKNIETAESGLFITEKGILLNHRYVQRMVKAELSDITTLQKKSPHVLRHTFATHMLNEGADINGIKELLGHTSLAATQVYTHTTIEKLKNIYKTAHPRA